MIDAVERSPAADSVVPLVAFNEVELRSHPERPKLKRFLGREFGDEEFVVLEQIAERAEHELIRARLRIDRHTKIDAEVLDRGRRLFVDNAPVEGRVGDVEIRFHLQRRQAVQVAEAGGAHEGGSEGESSRPKPMSPAANRGFHQLGWL